MRCRAVRAVVARRKFKAEPAGNSKTTLKYLTVCNSTVRPSHAVEVRLLLFFAFGFALN